MKLDRSSFSSLAGRLCTAGMAILGFSCSEEAPVMYGTPFGSFEIKGTVTAEDGTHVKDAEIRVTFPDVPSGLHSLETTVTNNDGEYQVTDHHEFAPTLKVVCLPDDPALEADSVVVEMKYKKGSHNKDEWDRGHAEATVDFRLKSSSKES